MEGGEKELFLDYAQRFVINAESAQHEDVVDFLLNHSLSRNEFDYWLGIGEKVNWRPTKTKPENATPTKSVHEKALTKDPDKSLRMRKEGSSHFAKAGNVPYKLMKLMKALECYNDALRHSLVLVTKDSSDLELEHTSVLFANRSAVFFEMSRYQKALDDIEMALKFGYPSHLRWKILIRKASIGLRRRKFKEVLEMVEVINTSLKPESPGQNIEAISRKLNILVEAAQEGLLDGSTKPNTFISAEDDHDQEYQCKRIYNTAAYEENPDFEFASKSIAIKLTAAAQRSVEALTDLKFGDILFDELPYASVLLPEYETSHCHHCHANTMLWIFPCRSCAQVVYCSENCSLESWTEYHQFECMHLDLLQSVGLGHLATRIALIARPEQILEALKLDQKFRDYRETIPLFRKGASKYQRVFSLQQHSEGCNPIDLFKYAEVAAFTTYWLRKRTSFFNGISERNISRIGGVILRHFCQLICNAQRIYSFPTSPEGEYLMHEKRLSVGSAIFASTSMMNHTCDPKISTNYKFLRGEGRRFIVKSVQDIPAGTEINNSYGLTFRRQDFETRQQSLLQQYFFKCHCERCTQEEKDGFSFVEQFSSFKCEKCQSGIYAAPFLRRGIYEATCSLCNSDQGFESAEDAVLLSNSLQDSGLQAIVDENYETALKDFKSCYSLRRKVLHRGHSLIAETYDSFARLYNAMGKNDLALPYLKKSVAHVKSRYGDHSNEYAQELQKYVQLTSDTALESEGQEKRKDLLNKANRLMEAYSPST